MIPMEDCDIARHFVGMQDRSVLTIFFGLVLQRTWCFLKSSIFGVLVLDESRDQQCITEGGLLLQRWLVGLRDPQTGERRLEEMPSTSLMHFASRE